MTPTTKPTTFRPRGLIALGACAGLLLGACGGDDDDDAAAVCEPYIGVQFQFNGEPDPATIGPLLDSIDKEAPGEVKDPLAVMTTTARTAIENSDFDVFESPDFAAAQSAVDPWMFEHCTFDDTAEVTAADYKFTGVPAELDAGTGAILITNQGKEAHEMAIMRKADGVTKSWKEILALPQEEAESLVVQVGGAFAPRNGTKGLAVVELVPGEYAVACFVPTGTSIAADGTMTEGTGMPHFMGGMLQEFKVNA